MAHALSFLTWQRLLGFILLLAAGLKAAHGGGVALPVAESLLGLWLLTGFHPVASRWAACFCFMVFLAVSLNKALAGAASCGCFGDLTVSPWLTAAFNTVVVASLCLAGRGGAGRAGWQARRFCSPPLSEWLRTFPLYRRDGSVAIAMRGNRWTRASG